LIQEVVDVKGRFDLVTFAIIHAGLPVSGLSDTAISIADTGILINEVTSDVNEASNSSASASIVIMMTGVLNE
jgi:hypothetical protein